MAKFDLYLIDDLGDVALAEQFVARTNHDAVDQAFKLRPELNKAELWRGNVLIAKLGSGARVERFI